MNAKRWGTHDQGCATRPLCFPLDLRTDKAHRLKPVLPSATLRTARKKNTQAKACATKAVLPAGAGPRPVLGMLHQAGGNGIVLDIGQDARELRGVANPMVERLILPERLSNAAQNQVACSRCCTLDRLRDYGERGSRFQEHVDVIGHHYERMQGTKPPLFCTS